MTTTNKRDPRDFYRNKCRHYTGGLRLEQGCKAGHAYTEFPVGAWPCLNSSSTFGQCSDFATFTETEIDERVARDADVAAAFFTKLANNICPECNVPVEGHQKIGRCVYAQPCNHRLWVGEPSLPPLKPKRR